MTYFLFSLLLLASQSFADNGVFRFHLKEEPQKLSPLFATSGTNHYILGNIYRGLTRYSGKGRLIFDLAEKCVYKTDLLVSCRLRKKAKWSSGRAITSQDVIDSFKSLFSDKSKSPVQELLFSIKNAKKVQKGELPVSELGLKKVDDFQLEFVLEVPDRAFLEKLSHPLLSIFKDTEDPFEKREYSGPYKIKSLIKGSKIVLEPNLYYPGSDKRPPVEVVFAGEDTAALSLYEKGVINFLWRVPTEYIPKYKASKDFFQVQVDRFDYIGFNVRPSGLFAKLEPRKALAESLDFEALKKILNAQMRPGCAGLGDDWILDTVCQTFIPGKKPLPTFAKPVVYWFSSLGGDDIKKSAEWVQDQWKKNLDMKVQVKSMDQKSYIKFLESTPPDLFRKGVALSYPACLAALENFETGHPDNYTGYSSKEYDYLLAALRKQKMSQAEQASVCRKATQILYQKDYVAIPMGIVYFTMLVKPEYQGWSINSLNQLDLSELSYNGK